MGMGAGSLGYRHDPYAACDRMLALLNVLTRLFASNNHTIYTLYPAAPAGADPAELKRVEREVKKEVDDAVEAAKSGTLPPSHWLWKNVYVAPQV